MLSRRRGRRPRRSRRRIRLPIRRRRPSSGRLCSRRQSRLCRVWGLVWEVLWGDGVVGGFGVPEDVHDPVAVAVFEELEAVDASGEGGGVGGRVAGLVGAPDLDDVAELFGVVVGGVLVEAGGGGSSGGAGDVAVDG